MRQRYVELAVKPRERATRHEFAITKVPRDPGDPGDPGDGGVTGEALLGTSNCYSLGTMAGMAPPVLRL